MFNICSSINALTLNLGECINQSQSIENGYFEHHPWQYINSLLTENISSLSNLSYLSLTFTFGGQVIFLKNVEQNSQHRESTLGIMVIKLISPLNTTTAHLSSISLHGLFSTPNMAIHKPK